MEIFAPGIERRLDAPSSPENGHKRARLEGAEVSSKSSDQVHGPSPQGLELLADLAMLESTRAESTAAGHLQLPQSQATANPKRDVSRDPRVALQILNASKKVRNGTPEEQAAARQFFTAHSGQPLAKFNLACMYLQGLGGERNDVMARELFSQLDKPEAKYNLAVMLFQGRGGSKDHRGARLLLAESVLPVAKYCLAVMHEKGAGGRKNYSEARRVYAEAATPAAKERLADLFATKNGGPQNFFEARKLRAEAGTPGAKLALAYMMLHGQGGPQDLVEARRLAVESQLPGAKAYLDLISTLEADRRTNAILVPTEPATAAMLAPASRPILLPTSAPVSMSIPAPTLISVPTIARTAAAVPVAAPTSAAVTVPPPTSSPLPAMAHPIQPAHDRAPAPLMRSAPSPAHPLMVASLQIIENLTLPPAVRLAQLNAVLQSLELGISMTAPKMHQLLALAGPLATNTQQKAELFERFSQAAARIEPYAQ